MRFALPLLLICLTLASACARAPTTYEEAGRCGGLPSGWFSLENFGGAGDFRLENRLHVRREGELLWNEAPVSEQTMQRYLKLTGSDAFPVPPLLHLVVDDGASCELVWHIRSDVSTNQGCSHHNCLEHTPAEWKVGAPPR
jgi:hypothetical protein